LHLRPATPGEDGAQDFTDPHVVRSIVQRYSDFVGFPIEMEVERFEPKEGGKPGEGGLVKELTVLNSMRPLWTRPKDEITADEHAEFYHQLSHDWEAPLETIHVKAEGTLEYTALLYLPAKRPMDLFAQNEARSKVALYVRRVLIVPECEDLLPAWLRWVRGVVDASDLPLNVSREVLQQNAQVRQIKKHLTKRVLESLASLLEKDRARYAGLWSQFGVLLKEGLVLGEDEGGRLAKLALFASTHGDEPVTLAEYVARMKSDQSAIWYLTGEDRTRLVASPHVAAFRQRGEEVLLLTDPVDEWLVDRLREFEGKPLRAVDRDDADAESGAAKEAREALEREHRDVLSALERELGAHVSAVRLSTRLGDAPAALQTPANAMSPHMARILRAAQRDAPEEKRVLVLNPDHALFAKLARIRKEKGEANADFGELAALVHGQALLAEGSPLPDPARFVQLLARWLTLSA
jgi:molecular chaperone HtpG